MNAWEQALDRQGSRLFRSGMTAEWERGFSHQFRVLPLVVASEADVVRCPQTVAHDDAAGFAGFVTPRAERPSAFFP